MDGLPRERWLRSMDLHDSRTLRDCLICVYLSCLCLCGRMAWDLRDRRDLQNRRDLYNRRGWDAVGK